MAFHSLAMIHALIQADAWDYGTDRSRENVRGYAMTRDDVAECLLSLTERHFRKEFGDAETYYGVLSTDAYVTEYDGLWLYIKFGVHADAAGQLCVIASFHTTN